MFKEQLYLLACVFASKADSTNLSQILRHVHYSLDFIKAACILWPELDDPMNLISLFPTIELGNDDNDNNASANDDGSLSDENLVVKLLENNPDLIPLVEVGNTIVNTRYLSTKYFIESKLNGLYSSNIIPLETSLSSLEDLQSLWLQIRILVCNEVIPEMTSFYEPLWTHSNFHINKEGKDWIECIIEPLNYINSRLGSKLKIKDFSKMDPIAVFPLILEGGDMKKELIPYLQYTKSFTSFLNNFCTVTQFPMDNQENYELLDNLIDILPSVLPQDEIHTFKTSLLRIIFENSGNLLKFTTLATLSNLVNVTADNSVMLTDYDNLHYYDLQKYLLFMQNFSKSKDSFKDLYLINKGTESSQLAHFASICKEELSANANKPSINNAKIKDIFDSIVHEDNDMVLSHLTIERKISILLETVLDLGEFDVLEEVVTQYKEKFITKLLLKFFWIYFNNSTNGSKKSLGMTKCRKVLNLLSLEAHTKGRQDLITKEELNSLQTLLDVSDDLSKYSMNLGKGHIFKPSNILDFETKETGLISILLESNNSIYKDISVTFEIMKKLNVAMACQCPFINHNQLKPAQKKDVIVAYMRLLTLHIDYSLVNMDFNFAYKLTMELFDKFKTYIGQQSETSGIATDERFNLCDYWLTIYQVGKFIDPNWLDNEIPTEILMQQMKILSKLLYVCPVEEVEPIISYWSGLELELSIRDLVNDKYSLEK
ncbi:Sec39p NDAI_0J02910 [Naumovozyma dairenensis CBS 421]|uniref:Sec39 domain-containing protein n=1 Tax=Naumovozyma dairenensis (strain ATCC 10597 / BCRC 20456 / CBS 421 / NBRC 0211 / NRRL Y-12639) TaxID=1071378 RepID=G0WHA5_NAUDC|nr:hypothetical protein NDAI_0J02910 [Naumovozyma dairenensis CBS 421]CCD27183.1 hypothetical protein NDAI_0J02910 [Naumovozyma dairenensis CBS 421]